MRINPVNFGKNGNLHATSKGQGFTFKLILFFESGYAFIVKATKRVGVSNFDQNLLYKEIKQAVEEMDFILMTPPQKMFNPTMNSTSQLLHYIQQKNEFNRI